LPLRPERAWCKTDGTHYSRPFSCIYPMISTGPVGYILDCRLHR
jgi:hypothetical protein